MKKLLKTLLKDERGGSASVEFAILVPGFLLVLIVIADLGYILFNRSATITAIEEANRYRAIGVYTQDIETVARVKEEMGSARATNAIVQSQIEAGVIYTKVSVPLSSLDMFGSFATLIGDLPIEVLSEQAVENWEV